MKRKKKNFNIYFFAECSIVYFLFCYYFKNLVLGLETLDISLGNKAVSFVHLKNTGAAFSLFKDLNIFLAVFSLCISVFIIAYVIKNRRTLRSLDINACAFLLAGILSNMAERFIDGYVTDYIQLNFINFPVFNCADIFINVGVGLLILSILCTKARLKSE